MKVVVFPKNVECSYKPGNKNLSVLVDSAHLWGDVLKCTKYNASALDRLFKGVKIFRSSDWKENGYSFKKAHLMQKTYTSHILLPVYILITAQYFYRLKTNN